MISDLAVPLASLVCVSGCVAVRSGDRSASMARGGASTSNKKSDGGGRLRFVHVVWLTGRGEARTSNGNCSFRCSGRVGGRHRLRPFGSWAWRCKHQQQEMWHGEGHLLCLLYGWRGAAMLAPAFNIVVFSIWSSKRKALVVRREHQQQEIPRGIGPVDG